MKKAFNKETLRSITKKPSRFLALVIIVALGAGFYSGLQMTGPDMRLSADEYYDNTELYDIRVLSTMGLTDDDITALEDIEGVEALMLGYQTDMVSTVDEGQLTVRIHSLDVEAAQASDTSQKNAALSDDSGYLNRPILVSGSWPTSSGECVVCADRVTDVELKIGDTIEIVEGNQEVDDVLDTRTFTIVGFVNSPYYSSPTTLGSTSLGSGFIQQYLYVPEEDFADDQPYTEIFLTVKGAKGELSGSDAYKETVSRVEDAVKAIAQKREQARHDQIVGDAQEELDEARAEFEEERSKAESELADAKQQLDDAAATLSSSETELNDGQSDYESGVSELADNRAKARTGFESSYATLASKQTQLDEGFAALEGYEATLKGYWSDWQQGMDALAAAREQLNTLNPTSPEYAQLAQEIAVQEATLDATKAELDSQQTELDQQRSTLEASSTQLSAGWTEYYAQKEKTEAQLSTAQSQLDSAAGELAEGRDALATGRGEYESNLATYEESRAEADQEFADAEAELADAQKDIDEIEMPEWYVMDRTKNEGAESYLSDAGRIDQIAMIFPLMFFLVAALVALTSMTRMVDEDRMLIGTHKALGYGRGKIISKYLIYSALASGVGSLIGIVTLTQFLPGFIINAYSVMYSIPLAGTPIDPFFAGLSAGIGIGVTVLTTWAAVASTLREKPAALMLPRAPKPGKRILLERITPLWKRVSFSWKVTFRNIFRYKRRFIMTIIGIAGCTGLLLTGLGLSNAIDDIITKQFDDIYHYNTSIRVDSDLSEEEWAQVDEVIEDTEYVSSFTPVYETSWKALDAEGKEYGAYVIVPEDPDKLRSFITLRERVGHQELYFDDDSIIISEKLSTDLGVGVGDEVSFHEVDDIGNSIGELRTFTVGGITENYIGVYIYISPTYYAKVMGEEPSFTTILADSTTDEAKRQKMSDTLLAVEGVRTVGYNDESISSYHDMLQTVNSVVVVLVIAAAVLAFVVLYNLTNINIDERQREIATLKVLGFVPREVDAYIFREIILLTLLGALVGLAFGVVMEHYVVITAEVNSMMFGREIHFPSYLISLALTLAFAAIVAIFMRGKLKKINMVESLKSVE